MGLVWCAQCLPVTCTITCHCMGSKTPLQRVLAGINGPAEQKPAVTRLLVMVVTCNQHATPSPEFKMFPTVQFLPSDRLRSCNVWVFQTSAAWVVSCCPGVSSQWVIAFPCRAILGTVWLLLSRMRSTGGLQLPEITGQDLYKVWWGRWEFLFVTTSSYSVGQGLSCFVLPKSCRCKGSRAILCLGKLNTSTKSQPG